MRNDGEVKETGQGKKEYKRQMGNEAETKLKQGEIVEAKSETKQGRKRLIKIIDIFFMSEDPCCACFPWDRV